MTKERNDCYSNFAGCQTNGFVESIELLLVGVHLFLLALLVSLLEDLSWATRVIWWYVLLLCSARLVRVARFLVPQAPLPVALEL